MKPASRTAVRWIARILCLILLLGSFAGCKKKGDVLLSLDGTYTVTEPMYTYWLSSYKTYLLYLYNQSEDTDGFWQSDVGGMTAEEYGNSFALTNVKNVLAGQKLFDEYGLTLSPDTVAGVEDQIDSYIEAYGSEAAFNQTLAELGINVDILRDIYLCEEKLTAVYGALYEDGKGVSEEQIDAYYAEHYSHVKAAVIYTTGLVTDDNGSPLYGEDGYLLTNDLLEDELFAQYEKAAELLQRANAGENFDDLIGEYSEFDLSSYPDGLILSENELDYYGYELVAAALSMEEGEIRSVEDENAIYVIKREPLTPRDELNEIYLTQLAELDRYCADQLYTELLADVSAAVTVKEERLEQFSIRNALSGIMF